jgi:hypothetical protein
MKAFLFVTAICIWGCLVLAQTQTVPKEIWGKWVVRRELPTTTISCWGESQAKSLIGTEIEYSTALFRWKDVVVNNPVAKTERISAEKFYRDNSGAGSNVSFVQLGIKAKQAMQISIEHAPADITGATVEIPGDQVLVRDGNTLVFSVCGLYFEARRGTNQSRPRQ